MRIVTDPGDEAEARLASAIARVRALLAHHGRRPALIVECHGGPIDGETITVPTDRPLLPEMVEHSRDRAAVYRLALVADESVIYQHARTIYPTGRA